MRNKKNLFATKKSKDDLSEIEKNYLIYTEG